MAEGKLTITQTRGEAMNSITKEITFIKDDCLISSRYTSNGHNTDYYSLKMLKPPAENYTVTYYLDETGPFYVYTFGSYMAISLQRGSKDWAPICFLPTEWDGKRVNRTVTSGHGNDTP